MEVKEVMREERVHLVWRESFRLAWGGGGVDSGA